MSNTQKEPTSTSAIHEKQAQEARRAAEPFKRERDDAEARLRAAEEERIRIEVQQAAEVARRLAEEKERAAESAKQRAAADEERRRKDNLVKRVKV